jgi:hypothetical protein
MFLILSALILAISIIDVGYSAWAIKRYPGLREANILFRWQAKNQARFIALSTIFNVAILAGLYVLRCLAWAFWFALFIRIVVCIRGYNLVQAERRKR